MISIYNYVTPVSYLSDYFNFKRSTDTTFSLSKWSKDAGFNSSDAIIDILKGKKDLKVNLAATLVDKVGLDATEFLYFLALTAKAPHKNSQLENMYDVLLMDLRPTAQNHFKEVRFSDGDLFSHWILTTILGATKLKDIELNSRNLKMILREEISEEIIELGFKYLLDQGLITTQDGKLVKTYHQVSTVTDKKHPNVNNYFHQMADLAKKAVDVSLEERELQSFNMTISKDQLPLIKEVIRKCRANLSSLSIENADEVYQMNMFFFPLTDSSKGS
ncbi:MAG: TIGR02147 family protein [Bdellovibrionales bacterium]|nr:TIGR02147 family protein [Bdellovibrionales bacterium]